MAVGLLAAILMMTLAGNAGCRLQPSEDGSQQEEIKLTASHLEAVERPRRLIVHHDYTSATARQTPWGLKGTHQLDEVVEQYMAPYEEDPNTRFVDTVIYELGEGDPAMWASRIVPWAKVVFPKWWEAGIDPLEVLVRETKLRNREVFFTYRINGSDVEEDVEFADWKLPAIKQEHRDWLIQAPWSFYYWNFAFQGVRDYKIRVLREIAEMYDIDGLQIDFARVPLLFPPGTQWKNRDHLTDFMRQLRFSLLEVERNRGWPLLLAVRIPENLVGCHFDGMEVERWVKERLIDLLIPGCGAADIDLAGFRRLVAGTPIRIYPSWDPIHPTEGYRQLPIEYWRGLYSKWWAQGADGIHVFNVGPGDTLSAAPGFPLAETFLPTHYRLPGEIGSPEIMRYRDTVFFVERRSGMHGKKITGDPYDWETPRHMYFMTYMLASLPTLLSNEGKVDTLLKLTVTDDVNSAADRLEALRLRLLLSAPQAEKLPDHRRLKPARLSTYPPQEAVNQPPALGIEKNIEVRVNNLLLGEASTEDGWLTFSVRPMQIALGENLIGIRLKDVGFYPDITDG